MKRELVISSELIMQEAHGLLLHDISIKTTSFFWSFWENPHPNQPSSDPLQSHRARVKRTWWHWIYSSLWHVSITILNSNSKECVSNIFNDMKETHLPICYFFYTGSLFARERLMIWSIKNINLTKRKKKLRRKRPQMPCIPHFQQWGEFIKAM